MEKSNTIVEIKHYVLCPYCEKSQSRVDHLFTNDNTERSFGHWYCDECGCAYKGKVKGTDVFIEKVLDQRKDELLVFLKNGNVLIAVKGMYFNGDFDPDNSRYFYEEHTCPVNYLGCEMVIDLETGDTDPHGIFDFVGAIPYSETENLNDDDILQLLEKRRQKNI